MGYSPCNLIDLIICLYDLLAGLIIGKLIKLYVIIGVIADEMAVSLHLRYDFLISPDIFPHKKKCGMDPTLPQTIQKQRCICCMRSVIKGKSRTWTILFFTPVRGCLRHRFCFFFSVLRHHQPEHPLTGDHSGHLHPKCTV